VLLQNDNDVSLGRGRGESSSTPMKSSISSPSAPTSQMCCGTGGNDSRR
jgi:hypothetical protein